MQLLGACTPKRTCLLANSNLIGRLLTGKLKRSSPSEVRTCRQYVDRAGKTRWQGTAALKGTQCLVFSIKGGQAQIETKGVSSQVRRIRGGSAAFGGK